MLAAKTVEKYYLALSPVKHNKKQGSIIGDMQKGRRGSYLITREKSNPAITRFFAKSIVNHNGLRYWFFVLKPDTGKTHQLRVALKSIGSPVLGDERYGQASADRGYLHAYKMRFELFGKKYEIVDPFFNAREFELTFLSGNGFSGASSDDDFNREEFLAPENLHWPKGSFLLPS